MEHTHPHTHTIVSLTPTHTHTHTHTDTHLIASLTPNMNWKPSIQVQTLVLLSDTALELGF